LSTGEGWLFCDGETARDIFSRVRLGSYIALELAVGAVALGGVVGGTLVVVSAVTPRPPPVQAVAQRSATTASSTVSSMMGEGRPGSAQEQPDPPGVADGRADGAAAGSAGDADGDADGAGAARPSIPGSDAVALATGVPGVPGKPGAATAPQLAATEPRPAEPAASSGDVARRRSTVYGAPDSELLAPLRDSPVTGCKLNFGGTSLSLRLDFESGGRAAFKPDQTHAQSQPRREVAAYRVDRMLGIGHVPPAAAIVVSLQEMLASIAPPVRGALAARIRAEALPRKGQLRGAASWWIPEIKVAAMGKYPIDSTDGIVTWRRYLAIDAERTPEITAFVSQISDMVLFDFLIDNSDRWSGGNARTSPDGTILYFMDNTLAFTRNKQAHSRTSTYLRRVKVFSRQLVENVRRFTREELVAALSSQEDRALAPLLNNEEIEAVLARRDLAVAYIDELILAHGADKVLAFP
jgi:hypothetical protein